MAAPVINLTTSVLGYQQWTSWAYQPAATNSPTLWISSPLPAGITMNPNTGLIAGAATVPGVYLVNLSAQNAAGEVSVPVTLTIGIDPSIGSNKSGLDVSIDTGTGAVTVIGNAVLKADDDLMMYITFMKGNLVLDLGTLAALQVAIKEFEPDSVLVVGNTFQKSGTGSGTVYQLYVKIDSTALTASLSNYESNTGTEFEAELEFEWQETNASGIGPSTLLRSSALFTLPLFRNLNAR